MLVAEVRTRGEGGHRGKEVKRMRERQLMPRDRVELFGLRQQQHNSIDGGSSSSSDCDGVRTERVTSDARAERQ